MILLVLLAPLLVACGGNVDAAPRSLEDRPLPTETAALDAWLSTREYERWEGWSEVGPTLGSGGARVFLSPLLVESLLLENTHHPVGAAAVRELYADDFTTLKGYSVLIKLAEPTVAESWFCFERLDLGSGEAQVAERGARGCTGCHAQGSDFVHSTLPLP